MKRLILMLMFATPVLSFSEVGRADPVAYVVTSASGFGSGGQFGTMDLSSGAFTRDRPG